MIKKIICFGEYTYVFIFKHYWDSEEKIEKPYSKDFSEFHLGLVFNRFKNLKKPGQKFFIDNYLIGINLLVIKSWVVFSLPNIFKK